MTTHGDIARVDLLKRGLIYFGDVLDEVRALPQPDIRAAVAVAAAHRLVQDQVKKGTVDPLALDCAGAVDSMWALLANWAERADPSTWPWRDFLRSLEESEASDRDLVAATIFAGQALATDEPDAAVWAVNRLIEARFAGLESPRGVGDAEDFAFECAAPPVQAALQQIRSNIRALVDGGITELKLAELRQANSAG
jgi:hypothetical protein